MHGFEVSSAWVTFRPLYKILNSVDGITDVRRQFFSDDRITFNFHSEPFIVYEPFGDNSRYWIGPVDPDASQLDMTPIHKAFQQYRSPIEHIIHKIINKFKGKQISPLDPHSMGR